MQLTVQDDILVFGGSGGHEKQPEYVTSEWSVASEFLNSKPSSVRFFWNSRQHVSKFGLTVTCKNGSKPEQTGATAQNWQYLLSSLKCIGTILRRGQSAGWFADGPMHVQSHSPGMAQRRC